MKAFIRRIINKLIRLARLPDSNPILYNNQAIQRQIYFYYQFAKNQNLLPKFEDAGFRVYSQNDEDGLLLYIFSMIGTTNKTCVDIAFGSPYGANTTNLICNWGWHGFLIEGGSVGDSEKFFKSHPDSMIFPPTLRKIWITAENVNQVLSESNMIGEIDLLSLDVDGQDYWILKNINVISPRVIVAEYLDILGPEKALTVPYKPDFNRFDLHPDFFGASLPAFVKLCREKGYRLVGVNRYGFNAFFVKNGIEEECLPEISAEQCFTHPKAKWGMENRLSAVQNMGWVEV